MRSDRPWLFCDKSLSAARRGCVGFCMALMVPTAWAAGGHHAVDDATTLDAGECHIETWYERARGGNHLLQLGPSCHVGGIDWTLSYEHFRFDEGEDVNAVTPEAKLAHDLGNGWAIAGALGATYDGEASRWQTAELRLPVSYFLDERAAIHATAARFFERGDDGVWFYGLGADVALRVDLELLVEAFREANEWFGRVGLRYFPPYEGLALDLSFAASEEHGGDRLTTLGMTWEFERPF